MARPNDEHDDLRTVALQNAGAILAARQRAEEELRRAKDALEARTAELREETRMLETLNRTGALLASHLDLRALLQAVTDAATELSGARFGAFVYDAADRELADREADFTLERPLRLYTLSGVTREEFARLWPPRGRPLAGPMFPGAGVIRCDDVSEDPRSGPMAAGHEMPHDPWPVRSYLAVPVTSRSGQVIGGLFFGHPEPGVFTERAERLVVGVTAQAAIAIDNARMYEAAQQAAEERRRLLESERAARVEAERANAMKDEFLATLSHELRTPLNAMLGWAQMLRLPGRSPVDQPHGLEVIERNTRALTQLIEDLLDMSRITSGKLRLDIQDVMPAPIVEAALDTVRAAATAKGIRLVSALDPGAGPVAADPGRLQQIVWNLLSNAIKFTGRHGRVHVRLARVSSHVEISVSDTGIGIPGEFVPHVFDRFRQLDASSTRATGGLGLGLSIVKQLVELHGGAVRVASEGANRGATFTVELPVMAVETGRLAERVHPRGAPSTSGTFAPVDLSGITVVVVDDDADGRDLVGHILKMCRAEVVVAAGADEALSLIERVKPHVLLSDIGMPGADGYELLRRVRELGPDRGGDIPAVALTAFARSEDRTRALRAGYLIHLAKPVDAAELAATVGSVVGRTGTSRSA